MKWFSIISHIYNNIPNAQISLKYPVSPSFKVIGAIFCHLPNILSLINLVLLFISKLVLKSINFIFSPSYNTFDLDISKCTILLLCK